MTTDASGRDADDRPIPAATVDDDDRRDADDDLAEADVPDHLDLPPETPEADALDQRRAEPPDEDAF
jgi:hypothetical protein